MTDQINNKYSFKAEGLHATEWQAGNYASCVPDDCVRWAQQQVGG